MAQSIMALGKSSAANVLTDGTVSAATAKFYAAAESAGDKASVWLARASLDLALAFPASPTSKSSKSGALVNVSAAHRYGAGHDVTGRALVAEDGSLVLDEHGVPLVPLVRVVRRQFARYVDAGAALVAAGYTAREVPTDGEVAIVRTALGIAYNYSERDQGGRDKRAPRVNDGSAPAGDAPAGDAPATGKRTDHVDAPAGSGAQVPLPTTVKTLSPVEEILRQLQVWTSGVTRDHLRLSASESEAIVDALVTLDAAIAAQRERVALDAATAA